MRAFVIIFCAITASLTAFAEPVCIDSSIRTGTREHGFGWDLERFTNQTGAQESVHATDEPPALLQGPRSELRRDMGQDESPVLAILPCAMAENGTFGTFCLDAKSYLVTAQGNLLCTFSLYPSLDTNLVSAQWKPSSEKPSSSVPSRSSHALNGFASLTPVAGPVFQNANGCTEVILTPQSQEGTRHWSPG